MKAEPTTRQLIEMLYERLPELFDRPAREPLTDEEMYLAIRPLFKTDALAQAALNISKDEYRAIEAAHGIKGDA